MSEIHWDSRDIHGATSEKFDKKDRCRQCVTSEVTACQKNNNPELPYVVARYFSPSDSSPTASFLPLRAAARSCQKKSSWDPAESGSHSGTWRPWKISSGSPGNACSVAPPLSSHTSPYTTIAIGLNSLTWLNNVKHTSHAWHCESICLAFHMALIEASSANTCKYFQRNELKLHAVNLY